MSEAPAPSSKEGLRLEHAVAAELTALGWGVEVEPVIGTARPDLLATDPKRHPFVIEVKPSQRSPHIATIAQIAAFVRLVEESRGSRGVRGVLLTTAPDTRAVEEPAETLGIWVIGSVPREVAKEGSEIVAIAQQWAGELSRRAMATNAI